ncbi:hypothetical protein HII36_36845 [Nonomuraea sp. NN258]|uniref:nucleotidyltransferase family protein n=1 Tax=Nonomuraea antri TaxID=2730852 RepID=UPI00156A6D6C|nr:nucleotidyltransferase family protein [Nonomuraea antri]NRQ37365.1 hypothetical protein [Nonomuraea antri]
MDEIAWLLLRHKVTHIALARIRQAVAEDGQDAPRLRELDREITRLTSRREEQFGTAGDVLAALRAAEPELPVQLMKGLAARKWYPAGLRRDVGDADLWVAEIDHGWRLAAALRGLGYTYESAELPWIKGDPHGRLFGQIRMLGPDGGSVSVDLHIGPYSVRYCGMLGFHRSGDLPPWSELVWEDNLCAVIVNAAGDCFIDAKTVNDLVVSLDQPLDFSYVAERIAEAELSGFLAALLDVVAAECSLGDEQSARLRALRGEQAAEPLGLAWAPEAAKRVDLVAEHADRAALRLTGDREQAAAISAAARAAYSAGKPYRLVRDRPGRGRLPELNPWTCVRLAPQELLRDLFGRPTADPFPVTGSDGLAAELELIRGGPGDLLRFRTEVFVPTTDYAFPVGLVDHPVKT